MIRVIIPSSNGRHLLEKCLAAISRSRYVDFEVVVVDNGSTDGTRQYIEQHYPRVQVIEVPEALGFSRAVNLGIRETEGEFVALLNNDTEVEPEWLYELVEAMRKHPEVGFCASKILKAKDPHLIYSCGDGFTVSGFAYSRGVEEPESIRYLQPEYVFGACAGAALYRRKLFNDIGLFDEDFYAFIEDADLSFRAQMRGYKCLYVASARVYHIGGATFGHISHRSLYYGHRNRISFIAKNFPYWLILRHLHSIVGHTIINIVTYAIKGQGSVLIKAHWDGLRTIPHFIRKRPETIGLRTVPLSEFDRILERHWVRVMFRLSRFVKRFYRPLLPPMALPQRGASLPKEEATPVGQG